MLMFTDNHVDLLPYMQDPAKANGSKKEPAKAKKDQSKTKKKKDLLKPPTSQELNALRETENLFHSNLFKLQVGSNCTNFLLCF